MKSRTDYPGLEMQTELQWAKMGYVVHPDQTDKGRLLWTNKNHGRQSVYFTPDQVEKASTAEQKEIIETVLAPHRQRAKETRLARMRRKKQEVIKLEEASRKEKQLAEGWKLCHQAEAEPVQGAPKRIALDLETTGLCICGYQDEHGPVLADEILQISLVDDDGRELFNTYVKPYAHSAWPQAQTVNGITPEMVQNAPYLHEVAPKIKGYLNHAVQWVGYNIMGFDRPMLEQAVGKFTTNPQVFDVMLEFAPIYGEWSETHDDFKCKSLSVCAEYFGIRFHAHDSLEDARATMAAFHEVQKCRKLNRSGVYHRRVTLKARER